MLSDTLVFLKNVKVVQKIAFLKNEKFRIIEPFNRKKRHLNQKPTDIDRIYIAFLLKKLYSYELIVNDAPCL